MLVYKKYNFKRIRYSCWRTGGSLSSRTLIFNGIVLEYSIITKNRRISQESRNIKWEEIDEKHKCRSVA